MEVVEEPKKEEGAPAEKPENPAEDVAMGEGAGAGASSGNGEENSDQANKKRASPGAEGGSPNKKAKVVESKVEGGMAPVASN